MVFVDLYRGFGKGKLRNVTAVFGNGGEQSHRRCDDLGNIILLNTPSRCGGIKDEWKWRLDPARFVPQKSDGGLSR